MKVKVQREGHTGGPEVVECGAWERRHGGVSLDAVLLDPETAMFTTLELAEDEFLGEVDE